MVKKKMILTSVGVIIFIVAIILYGYVSGNARRIIKVQGRQK